MRNGWAQPEVTFGEWAEDLLEGMGDVGWPGGLPNALPALLVLIPPQHFLLLAPAAEQVCDSCNRASGTQPCIQQADGNMPLLIPAVLVLGTTQHQSLSADRQVSSNLMAQSTGQRVKSHHCQSLSYAFQHSWPCLGTMPVFQGTSTASSQSAAP